VFPVRYKLDSYILFRINSVFKGLNSLLTLECFVFGLQALLFCSRNGATVIIFLATSQCDVLGQFTNFVPLIFNIYLTYILCATLRKENVASSSAGSSIYCCLPTLRNSITPPWRNLSSLKQLGPMVIKLHTFYIL
jgi:ABC-type tungstate transport system substrate-binding protein